MSPLRALHGNLACTITSLSFFPNLWGSGTERVTIHLMQGMVEREAVVDPVLILRGSVFPLLAPKAVTIFDLAWSRLPNLPVPLLRRYSRRFPNAVLALIGP